MRITKIDSVRTAVSAPVKLDANEQAGVQQVAAYFKSSMPGIGPMLQNPNNLAFLMKLLEVLAAQPNNLTILKNSLTKVQGAMAKDPTSTMALLGHV